MKGLRMRDRVSNVRLEDLAQHLREKWVVCDVWRARAVIHWDMQAALHPHDRPRQGEGVEVQKAAGRGVSTLFGLNCWICSESLVNGPMVRCIAKGNGNI